MITKQPCRWIVAWIVALGIAPIAATAQDVSITTGPWRAWLDAPGGELPFKLEIAADTSFAGQMKAWVINGPERVEVPRVLRIGSGILFDFEHYDSQIRAKILQDGTRLEGRWTKQKGRGRKSVMSFYAEAGDQPRFKSDPRTSGDASSSLDIGGRWAANFGAERTPAVGVFDMHDGGVVTGTFLTTTGDYRYLAGQLEGTHLRLSCFDGGHAFLFDATIDFEGTMRGGFWSGPSWYEPWTASRNDDAKLPDGFDLTHWVGLVSLDEMTFPDLDGNVVSLGDPSFDGKARIIQLFGTWCPNCHDEAKLLADLDAKYRDQGLSIVGLAFEVTPNRKRNAQMVRRFIEKYQLMYPMLLGGPADKDLASAAFPAIDGIHAWPTTIFLTGDGQVRAIHSGFSGPATGDAHKQLCAKFESIVQDLLAEAAKQPPSTTEQPIDAPASGDSGS